ncbi:hypothetical protein RND71_001827 [Anisodus tanguticus]|uniref:KIB1-4 beta-propeller domain-containing protein n=1 Tax=Anisodus tanguticus TaxID=243964 RepID=A0AAE1T0W4_9SOLA|nr:hypothetical protein RND71_001827 [Anisodus tanguticus]
MGVILLDFYRRSNCSIPDTLNLVKELMPRIVDSDTICNKREGLLFICNEMKSSDGAFLDENESYGVQEFHVYKIIIIDDDDQTTTYEEVKDLGNRTVFLGSSATLAVEQASGGRGRSRIYFTDDCSEAYISYERGDGKDMAIYNLLDGTIQPHHTCESYHKFSPPLWDLKNGACQIFNPIKLFAQLNVV